MGPGSDNFNLFAGAVGLGAGLGALTGTLGGAGAAGAAEGVTGSGIGGGAGGVVEGAATGGGGFSSLGSLSPLGGAPGAGGGLSTLNSITAGGVTPWGAATSGLGVGAAGAAVGPVAQALGDGSSSIPTTFGIPNNILGAALPAGLGYLGADSQSDAMKDIYNQTRADRMPALNAYNNALNNPNTFYQSAPAMGATDAVLRKLSMQGNPANNPGLLSQAAAYNLGGYNDYLRGLTPAAFGTANTEANISMNGAGADAGKYNAIGYGLGNYFNPQPSLSDLMKNFSLNIGGMKA